MTLLAGVINVNAGSYLETGRPWLDVTTKCFLVIGPNEELLKLVPLLWLLRRHALHERPLGLVGCALAIGLGFGALENWMKVGEYGLDTAIPRLLFLPIHPALTGIAAIFLAFSWIMPEYRWRFRTLAIAIPILIHGAIDWPIIAHRQGLPFPFFDYIYRTLRFVCIIFFFVMLSQLVQYCISDGDDKLQAINLRIDWTASIYVFAGLSIFDYITNWIPAFLFILKHVPFSNEIFSINLYGLKVNNTTGIALWVLSLVMAVFFLLFSFLSLFLAKTGLHRLFPMSNLERAGTSAES